MVSPENLSTDELLLKIKSLKYELEEVKQQKADLEIMIESIAEHSSELNNLYFKKNQELLLYIEQVKQLVAVTQNRLDGDSSDSEVLERIAARNDEIGEIAQVFLIIDKRFTAS
ncbi:hypothetical protein Riv7116_2460 [Rivularia sp. PCC 7116]|uniref:hypothetical protein n=1 Tax=Rivularia sp. PCC 7116 TaxID=373994 RepID=UPI00029F31BA|nr:hypothetical protein [Rivularia sp. PCC 7116]AFY54970.1 hypothetical protein Riv7116_2460 [Rivularia sp. PCC 7116]